MQTPATTSPRSWTPLRGAVGALVVAAVLWRLWLGTHYAGWEESDYGNLAMIEGVRAGGFLHYDMNHMPGYYALSALVHTVVRDAVLAGRTVALLGGVGEFQDADHIRVGLEQGLYGVSGVVGEQEVGDRDVQLLAVVGGLVHLAGP